MTYCGHPYDSIVTNDEGTTYCKDCEDDKRRSERLYQSGIIDLDAHIRRARELFVAREWEELHRLFNVMRFQTSEIMKNGRIAGTYYE